MQCPSEARTFHGHRGIPSGLPNTAPASTMRALLVVHDLDTRGELEDLLERRGWSVARAIAAVEALDLFQQAETPLFIVQDDLLGTGAELCRTVRRLPNGSDCYLIGLCRHPDATDLNRFIAAGVDDVIACPVSASDLEARVTLAEARIGSRGRAQSETRPVEPEPAEIDREFQIQKAFLEGLFEAAPEGVVLIDAEARVVRINSEFTRLFGYTPEEAVGRPLNELIVPDDRQDEGAELDGGVQQGERVMVETVRRHKDGRIINVSVLATHIDVDGPVGAFGIYRDITEKKRQEEALRESEERYRALFDQSPVGVFLCDEALRITHCNSALTRIVGAEYHQILGSHLVSLRDRRLIPGLRAALGGRPASYSGPYRSWTGEQYHVSIRYAPLRDGSGEVVGGMGVMENVTERVRAEMQLRAQAAEMDRVNAALRDRTLELEAAMQARTRLYTAMNHELRTPISAVMLYQELLLAESLGPLATEQRRALEHSHTATRHLLDLVRDILDLSKIEAGKVSVQPVRLRLSKLLDDLQSTVSPVAEHYGSAISVRVEDDLDEIVTDPQRVRQILMNFVSNAAKYGRQKPITIRCRCNAAGEVLIEVIDQGIGIAPGELDHIFEDFVQLGEEKEEAEGTGLGLAICRRLADLLGGRVEVESEVDSGSTFRLVLPSQEASGAAASRALAENPQRRNHETW